MNERPETIKKSKFRSRCIRAPYFCAFRLGWASVTHFRSFQVDTLDVGTIPRSITVILEFDLVESCQARTASTGTDCIRWVGGAESAGTSAAALGTMVAWRKARSLTPCRFGAATICSSIMTDAVR